MSQKVKITRVRVHGSVFLGDRRRPEGSSAPEWSADPESVMDWLCAGFRVRFNQHRSTRCRYLTCDDRDGNRVRVTDPDGKPVLVPIGRSVTDITDRQAREKYSFLAAVPAMVLQAPDRVENRDWFAAVKRRKTNVAKGRRPGGMPGFRSGKTGDTRLVCWFNGGSNAVFTKTGRRSGQVTITGMNPAAHRAPDGTRRWKITLHVRLSQPIRPYTSVRVNWTRRELVFVNAPVPIERDTTGAAVGIDRGVAHTVADSNGRFHDAPNTAALEKRRKFHQRKMAKSRLIAKRQHRQFWISRRYQHHKSDAAGLAARQARVREDFAHKVSTDLVRENDVIGVEDLNLAGMTRKVHGKGAAAKRGLNRVMARAALGRIAALTAYKADLAGVDYIEVNPAYTSQRCHQCGHTARENRESQAVFSCQECGYTGNADTNAAVNILTAALQSRATEPGAGQDTAQAARNGALAGSKSKTDPLTGSRPGVTASAMNREPLDAVA